MDYIAIPSTGSDGTAELNTCRAVPYALLKSVLQRDVALDRE